MRVDVVSFGALCLQEKRALVRGNEGSGRRASPPKRDDDRDGHYVFSLGENLIPRCEFSVQFSLFLVFTLLFVCTVIAL